MYKETETSFKLEGEMAEWFQVRFGVHQGSVLSPLCCYLQLFMKALTDVVKQFL